MSGSCSLGGCMVRLTWAEQKRQFARAASLGIRAPTLCQKHMTVFLSPVGYPPPKVAKMPRTEIYKHGEDISVVTTANEERDFIDTFTEALKPVMKNGSTPREQREAVRAGFDILAKLRGYKSEVRERRILTAGRWPHPSEKPVSTAGSDGEPEA